MRAQDFIIEGQEGVKIDAELRASIAREVEAQITSARKSLLPLGFFEIYDIFNAVATANGVDQVTVKAPLHNHTAAAPYSPIERKMLQAAYTSVGQPWDDSILDLSNNPDSQKTDGVMSPVIGFKGYAR